MFSFITYFIGSTIICTFIYLEGPTIIKYNVVKKYNDFRKINRLVSTNYKGFLRILWVTLCLIMKMLWLNFLQKINKSVIKLDKNSYLITYAIKGKIYKMVVKPKRGPRDILLVYNEKYEDISDKIVPYLGPEENWHGSVFKPENFGLNELTFELSNGKQNIFGKNQDIILY
jgi:hypothetical protein